MANYLCRTATPNVPDYAVVKAYVGSGQTLHAGDLVTLKTYSTDITNNYSVYTATQPATADLGLRMAIIVNDGFETLSDGRRPEGQPDYTQYTYSEGEVVTAIMLVEGLVFEISDDCISGTAALGSFLQPVNGSNMPTIAASRTEGTTSALKIMYLNKSFRMGGQMGGQFLTTQVCTVVV